MTQFVLQRAGERDRDERGTVLQVTETLFFSPAGCIPVIQSPSRKAVITGKYWEKCNTHTHTHAERKEQ